MCVHVCVHMCVWVCLQVGTASVVKLWRRPNNFAKDMVGSYDTSLIVASYTCMACVWACDWVRLRGTFVCD